MKPQAPLSILIDVVMLVSDTSDNPTNYTAVAKRYLPDSAMLTLILIQHIDNDFSTILIWCSLQPQPRFHSLLSR